MLSAARLTKKGEFLRVEIALFQYAVFIPSTLNKP